MKQTTFFFGLSLGFLLGLPSLALSQDEETGRELGRWGSWEAHVSQDASGYPICYASALPVRYDDGRDAYPWLQVTRRANPQDARNGSDVISFQAGYELSDHVTAQVRIEDTSFYLFIRGSQMWSYPNDDEELVAAMIAAETLEIDFVRSTGERVQDLFSLGGFEDAWWAIRQACKHKVN